MKEIIVSQKQLNQYQIYLFEEERSLATIKKYMRDILKFYVFMPADKKLTKEVIVAYKVSLESRYKTSSINSMLVALNNFLKFLDCGKFKVRLLKLQKSVFHDQSKELTKQEYLRLLATAKNQRDDRLYMLLQTLCATGIRVSEHQAITVESLKKGKAEIHNKGKLREVYFDGKLRKRLLAFCKRNNIHQGCVFITKNGKKLDRSNIWKMMKALCKDANVDKEKVFPHNLRHLFAFTYYRLEKDLVRLASILGHSSIETTRIYTMSSGEDCLKSISRLGLLPIFKE